MKKNVLKYIILITILFVAIVGSAIWYSIYKKDNEDFNFIVMDAEDNGLIEDFKYNLNHEIAHVIDRKLEYVSNIEDGHLFSETNWEKLNPKGFAYTNGESNELTMERYEKFGSYFAYSYGAKNAKEDRATIFGFCTSAYIEGGVVALGEGAIKKLDFYSECIRDAFDCSGWPEKTPWEYRELL